MKLWAILPELVLAAGCLLLVPVAGWVRGRARIVPALGALAALVAAIALTARMLPWAPVDVFDGVYRVDAFGHAFKLVIEVGALITVAVLVAYFRGHPNLAQAPVAVLFATLPAVLLVSSLDLALIVLFFQTMSIAGYVLAALVRGDPGAQEATLKYFVYGAATLAVMAYGLTFLYGLTGSLHLGVLGSALGGADRVWVGLALVLALVGYGFEITAVPFHFWSPDVLTGATAPVAGFLSVVPKVAAVAALFRLLVVALPGGLVGWPWIVAGLAAVTMTVGNLVALRQQRLKRLLAWSSVAQAGYVLMAVAVAERAPGAVPAAVPAAGYYLAAYVFMNLGAFAVVSHLERALGHDGLGLFRGLGRRAPALAALLTLALFSLAGIPPLAGFVGKVLVLRAVLEGGLVWLAVVAAVNWAVALFYYVRVAAEMYLREPLHYGAPLPGSPWLLAAHGVNVAGTVALGVLPAPLLELMALAAATL